MLSLLPVFRPCKAESLMPACFLAESVSHMTFLIAQVWDYSGYLYLIMEACLGGELFDVIMHRCQKTC